MSEIKEQEVTETVIETPAAETKIFADRCKETIAKQTNGFVRAMLTFIFYIANIFVDFFKGIKRNPSKLAGILIAAPGVFIGFLLGFHIEAVYYLPDIKWIPVLLFVMVLVGAINIFNAFSVMKKRSIGAFIVSLITSLIVGAAGVMYILEFMGILNGSNFKENYDGIDSNMLISIISVVVSIILSLVGCVLAFIFRDKEYQRDKS